eukprot:CAMPEP_0168786490 /NCGR_PEP_ID=MMETSP0725-20121227/11298_1 /TAXON_ID=265536 /ORGANISM="Amphiprora sp., Strain CCMP467" /LENGTH=1419 /DNA_ID=CAMNT_0008836639 /DNA_START=1268 /DNA_END=5527 /DNA_ORIENTATION=+
MDFSFELHCQSTSSSTSTEKGQDGLLQEAIRQEQNMETKKDAEGKTPDQDKNSSNESNTSPVLELFEACKANDIAAVQQLLRGLNGITVETKNGEGFMAIQVAALHGHVELLKYLLEAAGANVESRNEKGVTTLHIAAANGYVKLVKYLVESAKANVESRDQGNRTALFFAGRHTEVVKYLVHTAGADMSARNTEQRTALHMAAYRGDIEIVKCLCQAGADVEAKGEAGDTPLYLACQNGQLEVAHFLMEVAKASLENPSNHGFTPIQCASVAGHLEIVKVLYLAGANVERPDNDGDTALAIACMAGHLNIVQYLVETAEANVNSRNKEGKTPLKWAQEKEHQSIELYLEYHHPAAKLREACIENDLEAARQLMQAYDSKILESQDHDGWTPLHFAISKDYQDLVKFLVESGANVNSSAPVGGTPLGIASVDGNVELGRYLVESAGAQLESENGKRGTPLHLACFHGKLAMVEYLHHAGANVEARDLDGDTPLILACQRKHTEVVKYLVGMAKVDLEHANNKGMAPVLGACSIGSLDIVQFLHMAGANMEHIDSDGDSALLIACFNGWYDIVQYLVESAGVNVNVKNAEGKTPLVLAHQQGTKSIFEYLRSFASNDESLEQEDDHLNQLDKTVDDHERQLELAKQFDREHGDAKKERPADGKSLHMNSEAEFRFFKGALLNRPFKRPRQGSAMDSQVLYIPALGVTFGMVLDKTGEAVSEEDMGRIARSLYRNHSDGLDDDYFYIDFEFAMKALGQSVPPRKQDQDRNCKINEDTNSDANDQANDGAEGDQVADSVEDETVKEQAKNQEPVNKIIIKGRQHFDDQADDKKEGEEDGGDRAVLLWDVRALRQRSVFLVLSETSLHLPLQIQKIMAALEVPCFLHGVSSFVKFMHQAQTLSNSAANRLIRPRPGRGTSVIDSDTKVFQLFSESDSQTDGLDSELTEHINAGSIPFAMKHVWQTPWNRHEAMIFVVQLLMPWNIFLSIINTLHPLQEGNSDDIPAILVVNFFSNAAIVVMSEESRVPFGMLESLAVYPRFMLVSSNAVKRFREELSDDEKDFVRAKWLHCQDGSLHVSRDYGPMVMCKRLVETQALEIMEQLQTNHLAHYDTDTLARTLFYKREYLQTREGVAAVSKSLDDAIFCASPGATDIFVAMSLSDFLKSGAFLSNKECIERGLLKPASDFDYLLFVSHPWETAEHPDPSGDMYKQAVRLVRNYKQDSDTGNLVLISRSFGVMGDEAALKTLSRTSWDAWPDATTGVWVDWSCLPQKPRSEAEDSLFRQSLQSLVDLLCAPDSILVSVIPEQENYFKRSWCAFEWFVGSTGLGSYEITSPESLDLVWSSAFEEATEDMRAKCRSILGSPFDAMEANFIDAIASVLLRTKTTNKKDSAVIYQLMAEYLLRSRVTWRSMCETSDSFVPV